MSIEVIPEAFRKPFDPLDSIDHDLVRLYTLGRLQTSRGVTSELKSVFAVHRYNNPQLLQRMVNYGKFLESYDSDAVAEDQDYFRTSVFNGGLALALATVANMAYELDIEQRDWRQYWIDLPEGIDAPLQIKIDSSTVRDDCYKIGAAIINIGQKNLSEVEPPYRQLVEDVEKRRQETAVHSNIFQSSYGYVLGAGRRVLSEMVAPQMREKIVQDAIPDSDNPGCSGPTDEEYKRLVISEVGHV